MKYAIKHRYTGAVLYEAEIPDDTPSGLQCRAALEKATQARANLAGANLDGANLDGAYLAGAYLDVVGRFLGESIPLRFVDYEKPGLLKRLFVVMSCSSARSTTVCTRGFSSS